MGAKIIKEGVLRKQGYLLEARNCLLPLINQEQNRPYFKHIYHCLGWNYIESHEYELALEMLEKAYPYRESEVEKALTILLIGGIYVELGNYEKAQSYYTRVKDTILSSCSVNSKKIWFEKQFHLYWHTKQIDKLEELKVKLTEMIDNDEFPKDVADEIFRNILQHIANHISLKDEEYAFLHNFLV